MKLFKIIGVIIFSLIACKSNIKSDITKDIRDIDSAWNITKNNPTNENFYEYVRRVKQICQTSFDTVYTNKYIGYLFDYYQAHHSYYVLNLAEQCKCIQQFSIGQTRSMRYWAQKTLSSAQQSNDVDILDVYQLVGISYYMNPVIQDSVSYYWKLGFEEAVKLNDGYRIYFFANNLGTLFYEMKMKSISRQFFLKALQQATKDNTVSPTLINNIINTLVSEKSYKAAMDYYYKYAELLNVTPNNYENQSIYLNKIHLHQLLGELQSADALLKNLKLQSVHESHKPNFVSLNIEQYLKSRDPYFIRPEIKEEAKKYGVDIILHIDPDINFIRDTSIAFFWEIIESDVFASNPNRTSNHLTRNVLHLLAEKYEGLDENKYNKYMKEYARVSMQMENEPSEINNYIQEVQKVDDLFDEILKRNQEIINQSKNIRNLILGLVVLSALLILSLLYYRARINLKKKQEEFLMKEKEMLFRETQTNNRLIEFSRSLIEFNKRVKSELDGMNLSGDNTAFLKKFRSDLIGFVTVNLEQNPKVFDHTFEIKEKSNSKNDEAWNALNKTEKRIYTLTQEGFKANEIGRMLGVTTQYIYNIKAKLKRIGLK